MLKVTLAGTVLGEFGNTSMRPTVKRSWSVCVVHQLLQRADHRDRRAHRVLAAGERRRAGVARLAIDLDHVPACALDAGDHADLVPARLELRPLLDVRLDVGGDRKAERAARQLWRGGQGFARARHGT